MEQVVPLNVGEAEEKALREAMEERRQLARKSKVRSGRMALALSVI